MNDELCLITASLDREHAPGKAPIVALSHIVRCPITPMPVAWVGRD